jgi:hypothetical protein
MLNIVFLADDMNRAGCVGDNDARICASSHGHTNPVTVAAAVNAR